MEKLLLELIYGFTAGSLIVVFFIIFMAYELGKEREMREEEFKNENL
jgi:hypothetical protein